MFTRSGRASGAHCHPWRPRRLPSRHRRARRFAQTPVFLPMMANVRMVAMTQCPMCVRTEAIATTAAFVRSRCAQTPVIFAVLQKPVRMAALAQNTVIVSTEAIAQTAALATRLTFALIHVTAEATSVKMAVLDRVILIVNWGPIVRTAASVSKCPHRRHRPRRHRRRPRPRARRRARHHPPHLHRRPRPAHRSPAPYSHRGTRLWTDPTATMPLARRCLATPEHRLRTSRPGSRPIVPPHT